MTVHNSPAAAAPAILDYWLGEVGRDRWYAKDAALDARLAHRFGGLREHIVATRAEAWRDTPDHLLAAIIALDQFSRNLFRGSAKAFASDPLALELSRLALARGWDAAMAPDRRQILFMPLMHSEDPADQQRSLALFARVGPHEHRFAQLHHDQIAKFGRFPGRNAALGRRTTPEEQDALDSGAAF